MMEQKKIKPSPYVVCPYCHRMMDPDELPDSIWQEGDHDIACDSCWEVFTVHKARDLSWDTKIKKG